MPTVLIVDDSPLDRRLATRFLEEVVFNVVAVEDGEAALDQIAKSIPDVVLTDMQMPRLDGLGHVQRMTVEHPTIPVIVSAPAINSCRCPAIVATIGDAKFRLTGRAIFQTDLPLRISSAYRPLSRPSYSAATMTRLSSIKGLAP